MLVFDIKVILVARLIVRDPPGTVTGARRSAVPTRVKLLALTSPPRMTVPPLNDNAPPALDAPRVTLGALSVIEIEPVAVTNTEGVLSVAVTVCVPANVSTSVT